MAVTLYRWQEEALNLWKKNGRRGIIQSVTGAGKTIVGMWAISDLPKNTITTIVVPSINLIDQWRAFLIGNGFLSSEISEWSGRKRRPQQMNRINLMTYMTARKVLPLQKQNLSRHSGKHFIIADEVHKSGAEKTAEMFNTSYDYTMGLSATPERDDYGFEDVILKKVGKIVYNYPLARAVKEGVVSDFRIVNYGIDLLPKERREYEKISNQIKKLREILVGRYNPPPHRFEAHLRMVKKRQGANYDTDIDRWTILTTNRKRILYFTPARLNAALQLILQHHNEKIMVFHESIKEIESINDTVEKGLYEGIGRLGLKYALYHSKMKQKDREASLQAFKENRVRILLSVKALSEGTNVPDTDIAIIVASTGSLRQRIQTIGRALRKSKKKVKTIYTIFVKDSTDLVILQKYWMEVADGIRKRIVNVDWTTGEPIGIEMPKKQYKTKSVDYGIPYSIDTRGKIFRKGQGGHRLYSTNNPPGLVKMLWNARKYGYKMGRFYINRKHQVHIKVNKEMKYLGVYQGKILFESEAEARDRKAWTPEKAEKLRNQLFGLGR